MGTHECVICGQPCNCREEYSEECTGCSDCVEREYVDEWDDDDLYSDYPEDEFDE